ncbi:unnamed protein product [Cyprideis torosa]|uniref:Uncharacterized protein n=1 Tax=Cyprideis torosa TaxID=163714 RepID=A0A7R8ZLQ2_9CRUS|nr:unnamed protein product [Cyprideis torosa]CAG0884192.1 unnamed protein product [Cyprideis torosa]
MASLSSPMAEKKHLSPSKSMPAFGCNDTPENDIDSFFRYPQPKYKSPFDDDPEIQRVMKEEINEKPETRDAAIRELREFLLDHPEIRNPRLDAPFLLRFLRMQKFDVNKAKKTVEKYLKLRCEEARWYRGLDIQETRLNEILSDGTVFALPGKDRSGSRVLFHIAKRLDLTRFTMDDLIRAVLLTMETLLTDESVSVNGLKYILDFSDVYVNYVLIWSPTDFQKALTSGEKSFPLRHKQIVAGNPPIGFWIMYEIVKAVMSSKLRKRLTTGQLTPDMLLAQIPAENLPKEYGGTRELSDIIDAWKEECFQARDHVLSLDRIIAPVRRRWNIFASITNWIGAVPAGVFQKVAPCLASNMELVKVADSAAKSGDDGWKTHMLDYIAQKNLV